MDSSIRNLKPAAPDAVRRGGFLGQRRDALLLVTLEVGGEPPRDAVAQRAGVGIATLYRHFPDQQSLLRAVVLDVLDRTISHGQAALTTSPTGGQALRRYLHHAIDTRLGVTDIIYPMLDDRDWHDRRAAAGESHESEVAATCMATSL